MNSADDAFHLARSRYLDAMASVEVEVIRLLRMDQRPVNGECLGQKLERLKKITPSPRLSKDAIKSLAGTVDLLAPMLSERADIVHSQLSVRSIDGVDIAVLVSPLNRDLLSSQIVRLMTLAQFTQATTKLQAIALELSRLGRPPGTKKAPPSGEAPSVVPIRIEN